MLTQHHSIADGWSNPIMMGKFFEYYHRLVNGIEPEIIVDHAYTNAQQYLFDSASEGKTFWETRCASIEGVNNIGFLLNNAPAQYGRIRTVSQVGEKHLVIEGEGYES
ncbi:MAG: hypothetical protein HRT72_03630, partial [Flavobacteriales bacterium]|nr:hypothetical protein [Flavobacteriales bacterium]